MSPQRPKSLEPSIRLAALLSELRNNISRGNELVTLVIAEIGTPALNVGPVDSTWEEFQYGDEVIKLRSGKVQKTIQLVYEFWQRGRDVSITDVRAKVSPKSLASSFRLSHVFRHTRAGQVILDPAEKLVVSNGKRVTFNPPLAPNVATLQRTGREANSKVRKCQN